MTEPEADHRGPTPADGDDVTAARLRRRITREAAGGVSRGADTRRAVYRAARRVAHDWVPEDQLPAAAEVRDELHRRLDATGSLAHLLGDRFDALASCVTVLSTVPQDRARRSAGDELDRSLEAFSAVHAERPFDEELLTAALVHRVGLAIDRRDPVAATLEAIDGLVTPRTRWLIETLPAARAYLGETLGHRARKRLESHPDFLDVMRLAEADRRGGLSLHTPSLDEAVAILRELARADETPTQDEAPCSD